AVGVVGVRVVRQDVAADGVVFVGCRGVVGRNRRVVESVGRPASGGHVARRATRIDRVIGEVVGAEVVGVRRVGERAVGVECQRAVRRPGIEHGGQRVFVAENSVGVVGVRVVCQDVAADRVVFIGRRGVIGRNRRVV